MSGVSSRSIRRLFAAVTRHTKVCILGGGAGGVTLAGKLSKGFDKVIEPCQATIIDGDALHHYKPGWTLYSTKHLAEDQIVKDIRRLIPDGVNFVNQYVASVDPQLNTVHLRDGSRVTYEHLVVATGIQFNWDRVAGLKAALAEPGRPVCSAYDYRSHEKMRAALGVRFGKAVFTQPQSGITCGGAPQKVAYLMQWAWNRQGFFPEVKLVQGTASIFGVAHYAASLVRLAAERKIENIHNHELTAVEGGEAVFRNLQTQALVRIPFDFLHAVPPMSGCDYLAGSGLVDAANYVVVDKHTLRSPRFGNVWGLGDGTNLPTSKTMSALIEQAYVLRGNLALALRGCEPQHHYDGYTACPILVGGGKLILAEFKYGGEPAPTFFADQSRPSRVLYLLKRYLFPFAALSLMHRGLWHGRRSFGVVNERTHPTTLAGGFKRN